MISYSFFSWNRLSGVTLTPVPDKIETSGGILDSRNIYFGDDGSNGLIIVYRLVTFCVLVDYFLVLSISALGDTKYSLAISILSLGDTEYFDAYLSFKSSIA